MCVDEGSTCVRDSKHLNFDVDKNLQKQYLGSSAALRKEVHVYYIR
jgi:hypothetical protein